MIIRPSLFRFSVNLSELLEISKINEFQKFLIWMGDMRLIFLGGYYFGGSSFWVIPTLPNCHYLRHCMEMDQEHTTKWNIQAPAPAFKKIRATSIKKAVKETGAQAVGLRFLHMKASFQLAQRRNLRNWESAEKKTSDCSQDGLDLFSTHRSIFVNPLIFTYPHEEFTGTCFPNSLVGMEPRFISFWRHFCHSHSHMYQNFPSQSLQPHSICFLGHRGIDVHMSEEVLSAAQWRA